MTDTIIAVLELPAPIVASLVLEGGDRIEAQVTSPAAPIVAEIVVGGPAGPPADVSTVVDEVLNDLDPPVDLTVLFENALA